MRKTLSAMVVAAGLLGLGAAAQAAPVSATSPLGASAGEIQTVQMRRMERRIMRRKMERRMVRRQVRRNMMRRGM